MKGAMVDLSTRMQEIKEALDPGTSSAREDASLQEQERLLDELLELVESIDQAKDLSTIGGLSTLCSLLQSPHPSLQWRAAEVAATCVQNNPAVQEAFMNGGIMPALWSLLDSNVVLSKIKALLAVSCMIRGYPPALSWFMQQNGGQKVLIIAEQSEDPRLQRKCLQILDYILSFLPSERAVMYSAGEGLLIHLLSNVFIPSDDGDVRIAALNVAAQMAGDVQCLHAMQSNEAFVAAVQAAQCRLDTLPENDWDSVEEETNLTKELMSDLSRIAPLLPQPDVLPSPEQGAADTTSRQLIALPQRAND